MDKSKLITIDGIDYEIFEFKYYSGEYNNSEQFILFEDDDFVKGKNCFSGELYIVAPTYIEFQDLYQMSSTMNAMTRQYEVNLGKIKMAKLLVLCSKIIDHEGQVHFPSEDFFLNMDINFAEFILRKIEYVINKYYTGSGLTEEQEQKLELACFNYYKNLEKKRHGKEVVIPPAPGVVSLLRVCEEFNCTPDKARKISKRDIDSIFIAKQQKNICETKHDMIGL